MSQEPLNQPFYQDISIKELNNALNTLLKQRVKLKHVDGTTYNVPVFFRTRDSKLIPDATARGMIEVAFIGIEKAPAVYWNQRRTIQPITWDIDGNPEKYIARSNPEPAEMSYRITARAQTWDDIADIQFELDKVFPLNHRSIRVRDENLHLFRRSYSAADREDLGIFYRHWNIGIISYIFTDTCADQEEVYAIRSTEINAQFGADPNALNPELLTETIIEED